MPANPQLPDARSGAAIEAAAGGRVRWRTHEKGGLGGMREIMTALKDGMSVGPSANISKARLRRRCLCVVAAPVSIPADAGEKELESARKRVEDVFNAARAQAGALAAGAC